MIHAIVLALTACLVKTIKCHKNIHQLIPQLTTQNINFNLPKKKSQESSNVPTETVLLYPV